MTGQQQRTYPPVSSEIVPCTKPTQANLPPIVRPPPDDKAPRNSNTGPLLKPPILGLSRRKKAPIFLLSNRGRRRRPLDGTSNSAQGINTFHTYHRARLHTLSASLFFHRVPSRRLCPRQNGQGCVPLQAVSHAVGKEEFASFPTRSL